jgi:hypothetical protein
VYTIVKLIYCTLYVCVNVECRRLHCKQFSINVFPEKNYRKRISKFHLDISRFFYDILARTKGCCWSVTENKYDACANNSMNDKKGTPAIAGMPKTEGRPTMVQQEQKGCQQHKDLSNSRITYNSMNAKNSMDPAHGRRNLKTPTP